MSELVHYPDAFPTEALTTFRRKLMGENISVAELALSSWNVVGYALSYGLPLTLPPEPIGAAPKPDLAQVAELDQLIAAGTAIRGDEEPRPGLTGFPMGLLSIAIKLALKFLGL